MSPPAARQPAPVCLVIPPSPFLLDERVFVSLGILKIAAVLEQRGHAVEVLDLSGISNGLEALEAHAAATGARHFGLTATTPQMPAVARLAAALRRVRPDARLILGGPHPTLVSAAAKREHRTGRTGRAVPALAELLRLFDVVVAGDGEHAVFEALAGAAGLVDADDPQSPLHLTPADLERLPPPARHLVDMASYRYGIDGARATSVIAQLGCPFGCGFCGGRESAMLRRIRSRSTGSILAEIEHLHRTWGYTGFMFYDDELNVSRSMVELMNGLAASAARLGTRWSLRGFVKSELFTDEQAEAMYRAGFRWILTGFESGSPRILDNINKKATVEDNDRCVAIARRHGLKVKALMSMGHPGESAETVAATEAWLLRNRPDDFDVTIVTTYPGTPYYDQAEQTAPGIWTYACPRSGDRLHAQEIDYNLVADYYKGDPDGGYRAYVHTDHATAEELVALRNGVEARVRAALGIPFNPGAPAILYEHSMGMPGLPGHILRASPGRRAAAPSLRVVA